MLAYNVHLKGGTGCNIKKVTPVTDCMLSFAVHVLLCTFSSFQFYASKIIQFWCAVLVWERGLL